jgi:hypothetical protein
MIDQSFLQVLRLEMFAHPIYRMIVAIFHNTFEDEEPMSRYIEFFEISVPKILSQENWQISHA